MSGMKCPFCQQELHKDSDGYYTCYTDNCGCMKYGGNGASGSELLWLALIRTRKALEQSEICCTEWEKQALDYKAENIALSGDLERTRKQLEVAIEGIKYMRNNCLEYAADYMDKADDILEEIKKVEQERE